MNRQDENPNNPRFAGQYDYDAYQHAPLPHNEEAEKAILGAILLDNNLADQAEALVKPEAFFLDSHRRIYTAMLALHNAKVSIELITLRDKLQKEGDWPYVGGATYISDLTSGVSRLDTLEYYAKIVNDKYAKRKFIVLSRRLLAACYADDDIQEIFNTADSGVFEIMQPHISKGIVHISEAGQNYLERLAKLEQGELIGLATGITELDKLTAGLEGVTYIAARPGLGKTSLLFNMAQNITKKKPKCDKPKDAVIIFELEMSADMMMQRLFAAEARVDSHRIRTADLNREEYKRIAEAVNSFHNMDIFIDDTAGISLAEIRLKTRRLKAELELQGKRLALIGIDYINLMEGPEKQQRYLEVQAISRGIKNLNRELNVPIVGLTHLNRKVEERSDHRGQLSDIREASDIEQDADIVIFLHHEYKYRPTESNYGIAELIVAKQRNGGTGTIEVAWIPEFLRYEDLWKG